MGTSIMRGSLRPSLLRESFEFMFTCHTPPRRNAWLVGEDVESGPHLFVLRGLVIQKIEGLFAADSVPDSIEAPILCQTSADRFGSLFGLLGERFNFAIRLILAGFNSFQFRDAFQ